MSNIKGPKIPNRGFIRKPSAQNARYTDNAVTSVVNLHTTKTSALARSNDFITTAKSGSARAATQTFGGIANAIRAKNRPSNLDASQSSTPPKINPNFRPTR